jgi:hypothetical protein
MKQIVQSNESSTEDDDKENDFEAMIWLLRTVACRSFGAAVDRDRGSIAHVRDNERKIVKISTQ